MEGNYIMSTLSAKAKERIEPGLTSDDEFIDDISGEELYDYDDELAVDLRDFMLDDDFTSIDQLH